MTSPVVPGNAFQRRARQSEHEAQRLNPWSTNVARGVIAKVYDVFVRQDEAVPETQAALLARYPGMVMADVMLLDNTMVTLPLAISADERYLVYGNSANMQGRPVEIVYHNQDIRNGRIYLRADNLNFGVREDQVAEPFDIAGVVK